ncbi:CorA family divalent cation transporter [Curtobacterium sp. VKM Ac-1393]|nr:CorA family divalent cation transporter [Curtobacterium sp. VKM Ac-1393]MBF4609572.1 hypothetical protein [Curtobacterium sp. VKM Ac-1393]
MPTPPRPYGMNFEHRPELRWVWGYPAAIIAMALSAVVLWAVSKRKHWL